MGWELEDVEKPFVAQLKALGWTYIAGSLDDPAATGREHFGQAIQLTTLREKLKTINRHQGRPWLDDARVDEAIAALTRLGTHKLIEANEKATELLLKGTTVAGLPGWDGGRSQVIQYIDWALPANNDFTVVNQFRIDCPPGYNSAKAFIVPDIVLLVNGIPLVVIECKSPSANEPLPEAVDQLRRYSNQRKAAFEITENEGVEALFHTNQLLVATSYDEARIGTLAGRFEHFAAWKTVVAPDGLGGDAVDEEVIANALGKTVLSEQERLIAGVLIPANLLDIVRHFTLFMEVGGTTIKAVCRHQQYRAVNKAIRKLKTGETRLEHGESDQRGGLIWHTQGSGKSLSMVFLVRKMRADSRLRRFKVIVVTDRRDLQRQLSATAALTGDNVEVANSAVAVKAIASRVGPGLVFATIQKYRDLDQLGDAPLTAEDLPKISPVCIAESPVRAYKVGDGKYEVLNVSEDILVLVDEAHRTQGGDLHANLLAGLPNCARIGFTGTPIIMGEKRRTHEIFGAFIDRYTIKQSEADGATVPVLYEGRTAKGALRDGASLDELFEDLFRTHTRDELEAIKKKYATKGNIFDAPALINEKARDILRHYVTHILPNGFKAQVVAHSRLAAIRYFDALHTARSELLAEAAALDPEDRGIDDEALCQRPPAVQARVMAWRNRELLAQLEFAPIISGSTNDDPLWAGWTDQRKQEQKIKRFKMPLVHVQPDKADPLAMLIVKSMLLTGFDAPIAGVMYLDRPIREAELLQAIARVNRTGYGKQRGIVVDYYGVAQHLKEALEAYADEDIEGVFASLRDEIPILRDRHFRVMDLFKQRGIATLAETEECVLVLANEKLRAEFAVKLKAFLSLLDVVLPRPEALPFSRDAKKLAYIYARARNRYKDSPVLGKDIGAKVRKLIDDHVISLGIDPKIPPIQLTDADFAKHLSRQVNDRAKASEMEHAIRAHIRQHLDEDPVKYRKLSERLNDLLKAVDSEWDAVVAQLQSVIDTLQQSDARVGSTTANVSAHYLPFMRTVFDALADTIAVHPDREAAVTALTRDIVDMFAADARGNPSLWKPNKIPDQEDLKARVFEKLTLSRLVPFDCINALADALVSQARANQNLLGVQ